MAEEHHAPGSRAGAQGCSRRGGQAKSAAAADVEVEVMDAGGMASSLRGLSSSATFAEHCSLALHVVIGSSGPARELSRASGEPLKSAEEVPFTRWALQTSRRLSPRPIADEGSGVEPLCANRLRHGPLPP
ncbi:hypothetical protein BDFB_008277 [Asbolus verrucosus]|uniref:Uncharacterized protein n=1 Tax=Asbolus verrucosus TaxID=1661398 RepID=A0A482W2P0_ASBVE|nr:hypothetical protein BDFB_008277 [Asbolus verrucosus]